MNAPPPESLKKQVLTDARGAVMGNDYVQLLRYRWARGLALVIAIAATVIGLLGGFERAAKPSALASLKPQPAGAAVDGGLYKMTVHSAWVSYHTQPLSAQADNSLYNDLRHSALHVAATVTYQFDRPLPGVADIARSVVWLHPGPDGKPTPQTPEDAIRIGGALLKLQPSVPTQAILTWRLPDADVPGPARVRLGLMGYKFLPSTWLTQQPGWVSDKPAGIWDIAVQDRRPAERAARQARSQ